MIAQITEQQSIEQRSNEIVWQSLKEALDGFFNEAAINSLPQFSYALLTDCRRM
jgi:hypothetical protein